MNTFSKLAYDYGKFCFKISLGSGEFGFKRVCDYVLELLFSIIGKDSGDYIWIGFYCVFICGREESRFSLKNLFDFFCLFRDVNFSISW